MTLVHELYLGKQFISTVWLLEWHQGTLFLYKGVLLITLIALEAPKGLQTTFLCWQSVCEVF